jgi:hypothetical protein
VAEAVGSANLKAPTCIPAAAGAAAAAAVFVWEWEDGRRGSGLWRQFDAAAAASLAAAADAGDTELVLQIAGKDYTVDLASMRQTNAATGHERAVRRREAGCGSRIRWNSARSEGCKCCAVHGGDCPGHPDKGHHFQMGREPCRGRCATCWC